MNTVRRFLISCIAVALAACAAAPERAAPAAAAHDNLDATLWMQTSAEYRAAALGVYAAARRQLDAALAEPCFDALPEGERDVDPCGLPPALISDADETLIDNSAYQARRIRDRDGFVYENWLGWVNERRARAIPGAVEFARYAASRGVRVFYVTGRDAPAESAATAANLSALGFPVDADGGNLLLRGDPRAPGREKGERRRWVGREHRVLLLLGDNLGDFLDGIDGSIAERAALVEAHAGHWGRDWFMLPNPAYGSWEGAIQRACGPAGETDPSACKRRQLRVD